jgi:hypothetical protein
MATVSTVPQTESIGTGSTLPTGAAIDTATTTQICREQVLLHFVYQPLAGVRCIGC